jgi:glycosyltransferase involved in cell wall biosynthesis
MQADAEGALFTVLLQVYRPPAMLPCAIESVLAQTLSDFELFIVCDGAPEATMACARSYADRDPRVKIFPFPKGEHTGLAHRHTALMHAKGRYIAHIGDDDLWFPNHLEEMEKLLSEVDFGHTINVHVLPDGSLQTLASDLGNNAVRQRQLNAFWSQFAEAVTGYRLTAYRRIPEGWTRGPQVGPELYTWRKFLRQDDITCGTRMRVTALVFGSDPRKHMSLEERGQEVRVWQNRIRDASERAEIIEEAWRALMRYTLVQSDHNELMLKVVQSLQVQLNKVGELVGHRLQIGSSIDFSERGLSCLYATSGWSIQEPDQRWTEGKEAVIRVRLEPPLDRQKHDKSLMRLRALAFQGPQRVTVSVNGCRAGELAVNEDWQDYDVEVPNCAGEMEIKFQLQDAHSPSSVGVSEDTRELGIAVTSVTFLDRAEA